MGGLFFDFEISVTAVYAHERVRPTQVQKRDPKGLYAKVAAGEIKSFTGMSADAPYEAPLHPEVDLPNRDLSVDECVQRLLDVLRREGRARRWYDGPFWFALPPGYVDGWLEDSLHLSGSAAIISKTPSLVVTESAAE